MNKIALTAFAFGVAAAGGVAQARSLAPMEAHEAALGASRVVSYYVVTNAGPQVVSTVMTGSGAQAVVTRSVAVLQPGGQFVMAVPGASAGRGQALVFRRVADGVDVARGR